MSIVISNLFLCAGVFLCECVPIFARIPTEYVLIICAVICLSQTLIYMVCYKNRALEYIKKREAIYLVSTLPVMFLCRVILNAFYEYIHLGDNYAIFLSVAFFLVFNLAHWFLLMVYLAVCKMRKRMMGEGSTFEKFEVGTPKQNIASLLAAILVTATVLNIAARCIGYVYRPYSNVFFTAFCSVLFVLTVIAAVVFRNTQTKLSRLCGIFMPIIAFAYSVSYLFMAEVSVVLALIIICASFILSIVFAREIVCRICLGVLGGEIVLILLPLMFFSRF